MKFWRILFIMCPLLNACDRSSLSHLFQSEEDRLRIRADEIESTLLQRLQEKHPGAHGTTWNPTRLQTPDNWLVASTDTLWNTAPEARPATDPCVAHEKNCQPQFTRVYCAVDSDCAMGLSCQPLAASVHRLGDLPDNVCQYPSDRLLDALYGTVTQAEQQVDISSLSAPYGRFHEALVNALSIVSQKGEKVRVRILYSGEKASNLNIFQPPKNYTERLRRDIASRDGQLQNLDFNVAWLSSASLSWNHAKVIVADQRLAFEGGHNFWDTDYLGRNPVQDLSMHYSGPAIADTTAFLDLMWNSVAPNWFYAPAGTPRFPPFFGSLTPDSEGDVKALSLARMGVYGDNASDDGLAALIDSAKSEIMIAQQDVYMVNPILGKPIVAANLFRAALRGVRIGIVQSNKDGLNYGMTPADKAIQYLRADFAAFVKKEKLSIPGGQKAEAFFCNAVVYAPLRYSSQWSSWSNGGPLSLHAKLIIADRAAFYLGSHNIYPSNLQEFGLVVFDPERTRTVLETFWEPMYEASAKARPACL